MMQLDTARAMISNPEGWNRDDILKAAKVLSDALPTGQTAREIVNEERREATGRLLLAMTSAMQLTMQFAYLQCGHSPDYDATRKELRDAAIIFAGTLDKR